MAVKLAKKHGAYVNDLYALLKDAPQNYHSDVTHYYTEEGTRVICNQVIGTIAKVLNVDPKDINYNLSYKRDVEVYGI